tara:strand:+ start:5561 stop:6193 length:633 start_codon:yes stop_codon:yes gene_type:complete
LIKKNNFRISAILIVIIASGCASSVSIKDTVIPKPHFKKLPLIVALRIPPEFNNFVHKENVLGQKSWSINLGSSNATLFKQVFKYMFDDLILIGPKEDASNYIFDALIEPKIEGFEFSVPNQSKTDAFVVWIRYQIKIFDNKGSDFSTWTVSAYGKSYLKGLGKQKSLQRAANLAMRDAAALILLQMNKVTKIGTLNSRSIEPETMIQEK